MKCIRMTANYISHEHVTTTAVAVARVSLEMFAWWQREQLKWTRENPSKIRSFFANDKPIAALKNKKVIVQGN